MTTANPSNVCLTCVNPGRVGRVLNTSAYMLFHEKCGWSSRMNFKIVSSTSHRKACRLPKSLVSPMLEEQLILREESPYLIFVAALKLPVSTLSEKLPSWLQAEPVLCILWPCPRYRLYLIVVIEVYTTCFRFWVATRRHRLLLDTSGAISIVRHECCQLVSLYLLWEWPDLSCFMRTSCIHYGSSSKHCLLRTSIRRVLVVLVDKEENGSWDCYSREHAYNALWLGDQLMV